MTVLYVQHKKLSGSGYRLILLDYKLKMVNLRNDIATDSLIGFFWL